MASKISIPAVVASINTHWHPKLVASIDNAYDVKIAKLSGAFIFHSHPDADELFYILRGQLTMEIEDGEAILLGPGDLYVVPKGVRHRPVVNEGVVEAFMVEKSGTVNTGDEPDSERTRIPEDVRAK